MTERKIILWSSDLGPIIKQGDDYTFQRPATVYNNLPKGFKEIIDFKAYSGKIKGFYKDKALARALSLSWVLRWIFAFVSNYAIAVCFGSLLFFRFNFDSVLYLSPWPLISLNFVFYWSIQVHPVIANISCWFIVVPISTKCVSLSVQFNKRMAIILSYQYLNFSKYLRNPYIYPVYFVYNFNCFYLLSLLGEEPLYL